jgi:hypothetical protein
MGRDLISFTGNGKCGGQGKGVRSRSPSFGLTMGLRSTQKASAFWTLIPRLRMRWAMTREAERETPREQWMKVAPPEVEAYRVRGVGRGDRVRGRPADYSCAAEVGELPPCAPACGSAPQTPFSPHPSC